MSFFSQKKILIFVFFLIFSNSFAQSQIINEAEIASSLASIISSNKSPVGQNLKTLLDLGEKKVLPQTLWPYLPDLLRHSNKDVRNHAFNILKTKATSFWTPEVIDVIVPWFSDPDPMVRSQAFSLIRHQRVPNAIWKAIPQLLKHHYQNIVIETLNFLANRDRRENFPNYVWDALDELILQHYDHKQGVFQPREFHALFISIFKVRTLSVDMWEAITKFFDDVEDFDFTIDFERYQKLNTDHLSTGFPWTMDRFVAYAKNISHRLEFLRRRERERKFSPFDILSYQVVWPDSIWKLYPDLLSSENDEIVVRALGALTRPYIPQIPQDVLNQLKKLKKSKNNEISVLADYVQEELKRTSRKFDFEYLFKDYSFEDKVRSLQGGVFLLDGNNTHAQSSMTGYSSSFDESVVVQSLPEDQRRSFINHLKFSTKTSQESDHLRTTSQPSSERGVKESCFRLVRVLTKS